MRLDKNKLELKRANKCITISQLAKKAGVSNTPIVNCENVNPVTAGKIAKALGVSVEEILADEEVTICNKQKP